jgi:hypothetical protein
VFPEGLKKGRDGDGVCAEEGCEVFDFLCFEARIPTRMCEKLRNESEAYATGGRKLKKMSASEARMESAWSKSQARSLSEGLSGPSVLNTRFRRMKD